MLYTVEVAVKVTRQFIYVANCIAVKPVQLVSHREAEIQAAGHRQVHGVAVVERSTLGQCRRAVGSRRVAQDIEQDGLAVGHQLLAAAQGEEVEHVGVQRLGLEVDIVLHGAEGHRPQGILHAYGLCHAVGLQCEGALSEAVQAQRVNGHAVLQAVVHGGLAAAYGHEVNLLCRIVIVIYIALSHLHLYVVFALQAEHGVAEGVLDRRRVLRVLVGQRHLHAVALQVGGVVELVAEVVEGVVAQLLVGQLHRAAIYSVIYGVI